ncbi:MAG TPA: hypothetical protein VJR04_01190 [Terriglobales bacterium]|nr:hypothetical protein [Terriglobales bacterium]
MNRQIFAVLFLSTSVTLAQTNSLTTSQAPSTAATTQNAPTVQAKEGDVRSIESILAATYDVISGSAGKKRDWDRFRSLFYPGARLIPTGKRPNETEVRARVLTPDDYVERSAPFLEKEGFFERGVSNKIERFGNIAQVFSTYESRHNADDMQPFQRGINSFQLVNDGKRWWIMTIMWQAETPENPIPQEYLRK